MKFFCLILISVGIASPALSQVRGGTADAPVPRTIRGGSPIKPAGTAKPVAKTSPSPGAGSGVRLRSDTVKYLESEFANKDANQDGFLTLWEFSGGQEPRFFDVPFFQTSDVNRDKKLSREEFVSRHILLSMFDEEDANKDGMITPNERSDFRERLPRQ